MSKAICAKCGKDYWRDYELLAKYDRSGLPLGPPPETGGWCSACHAAQFNAELQKEKTIDFAEKRFVKWKVPEDERVAIRGVLHRMKPEEFGRPPLDRELPDEPSPAEIVIVDTIGRKLQT